MVTGGQLRDAGIELVSDNEKEEWKASYRRISARWFARLPKGEVFHGEAMRVNALHRGLPEPHHANVWGAVASSFLKPLLKDGLIEEIGMLAAASIRAHARRGPAYRKLQQGEPVVSETIKEVIALYRQLRDRKEEIEASIKPKLIGIREDMAALEGWLLEQAEEAGVKSFRTDAGTAFITTQDSATVADWDKTLAYIVENEAYELLEKRVSKTVVRDLIEENGAPPPGVNFNSRRAINVRAPAPE